MVKFGVADYGIDVYEGGCFSLEQRLLKLKKIGFEGIECLHGADMNQAFMNAMTFHKLGMDFVSCSMSNFEMSIECACAFGKEYVWLPIKLPTFDMDVYCRQCRAFTEAAAALNVKGALHNHLGARIESQDELEYFMKNVPDAQLLLDVGHLEGANGDSKAIIRKYSDRLASVHLKGVEVTDESFSLADWDKRYRLCGLAEDTLGIDFAGIIDVLKEVNYDKWLLLEHDTHIRDPFEDLANSLAVLKKYYLQ